MFSQNVDILFQIEHLEIVEKLIYIQKSLIENFTHVESKLKSKLLLSGLNLQYLKKIGAFCDLCFQLSEKSVPF